MNSRITGFTLAEVLITIGIIGIISALTIPNLIQKYQEHVTVTKVKKMYSLLNQAYKMHKAQTEIPMGNTQSTDEVAAKEIADVFMPYLKVARDCGTDKKGCIYNGFYKTISGIDRASYEFGNANPAYRILLNDGGSVFFRRTTSGSAIFYDVNGKLPPNKWGYDFFEFFVDDIAEKVYPAGENDISDTKCLDFQNNIGSHCAGYIIRHGNMNYLHNK